MTTTGRESRLRWGVSSIRLAAWLVVVMGFASMFVATAPGCGKTLANLEPSQSGLELGILGVLSRPKLDILISIDNSRSMADKQEVLRVAVPDLVNALVNPRCVDGDGRAVADQPDSPLDPCPMEGSRRAFEPLLDVHIGVITSSLGSHGADTCSTADEPSNNDFARLIYRVSTDSADEVPTWNDKRFLVWDPDSGESTHSPQGESDEAVFISRLSSMIAGAGQLGCGFEAQLESWYRFLVEPEPHASVAIEDGVAVLKGRDDELLQQRRDFLRPDSFLAIIMLSDENDCSIRDGGNYFLAAQSKVPGTDTDFRMPKPRAACATDPSSPCCTSCNQDPGPGCDTSKDDCDGDLGPLGDALNLRCFDQKRRFGIDLLYPVQRYIDGLTSKMVMDKDGNVVENPIFSNLNPDAIKCGRVRDSGEVFLTAIVGVPWQDIARRDVNGEPNLDSGEDVAGRPVGGFQTFSEMVQNGTWDIILGDPENGKKPSDPLMVESVEPRTGTNPVTGDPLQPPSAGEGANPINGHEYSNALRNDLQYACIFPLQEPRDCSGQSGCDCSGVETDNPLCDPANGSIQKYAKAYPGLRELAVVRGLGNTGLVGSICPAQQADSSVLSYGYRAAMGGLVERLTPALGGGCFRTELEPDTQGRVPCRLIEARSVNACDCNGAGRRPLVPASAKALDALSELNYFNSDWNCFCEVPQAEGKDLVACQNDVRDPLLDQTGNPLHSWCYVDPDAGAGSSEIVAYCPADERRIVRFLGATKARACSTLLLACVN